MLINPFVPIISQEITEKSRKTRKKQKKTRKTRKNQVLSDNDYQLDWLPNTRLARQRNALLRERGPPEAILFNSSTMAAHPMVISVGPAGPEICRIRPEAPNEAQPNQYRSP